MEIILGFKKIEACPYKEAGLTRSTNPPMVHWAKTTYSKIFTDHFWSIGPEVVFLYVNFRSKSARNNTSGSATFDRGISDKVKLSYADDIGVWFLGLKVCNFRRILLSIFSPWFRRGCCLRGESPVLKECSFYAV